MPHLTVPTYKALLDDLKLWLTTVFQGMGRLEEALLDFDEAVRLAAGAAAFFRSVSILHTSSPAPIPHTGIILLPLVDPVDPLLSYTGTEHNAGGRSVMSQGASPISHVPSSLIRMMWPLTSRGGTGGFKGWHIDIDAEGRQGDQYGKHRTMRVPCHITLSPKSMFNSFRRIGEYEAAIKDYSSAMQLSDDKSSLYNHRSA